MDRAHIFNNAFEILCEVLMDTQVEIYENLKSKINKRIVNLPKKCVRRGRKTERNDFSDYLWIPVIVNNNEYWLTLFYNDINKESGNPRTQFGKIQFWKNISHKGSDIGTPHTKLGEKWLFESANAGKDLGKVQRIGDERFTVDTVVDEFIKFIEENEQIVIT